MKHLLLSSRRIILCQGALLGLLASAALGCADADSQIAACLPSAAADPGASKEAAIDPCIEGAAASMGMPGVQTTAIKNGELVWAKSYGLAVTAPLSDRAVTNDTIFALGAISSELIAVALAQRVDAGAIGFDDDISLALPWPVRNPRFPDVPITWRMVLSYTAGFNSGFTWVDDLVVFGADAATPMADVLRDLYAPDGRHHGAEIFRSTPPGTAFYLDNFGIALAAYAVELNVGKPFHEYVREQILEPLGMQGSYLLRDVPEERLAVGYMCDPVGPRFTCHPGGAPKGSVLEQQDGFPLYPIVLFRTTATEYLKFVAMLLNDGQAGDTTILSKASVDELLAPLPIETIDGREQGLIFRSLPGSDGLWGNMAGGIGIVSSMFFDRESKVAAMALGNARDEADENRLRMSQIVEKLVSAFR